MPKQRFGVSVPEETSDKLEMVVEECADLRATRSEIIAAVLAAYFQFSDDEIARTRELLIVIIATLYRRRFVSHRFQPMTFPGRRCDSENNRNNHYQAISHQKE